MDGSVGMRERGGRKSVTVDERFFSPRALFDRGVICESRTVDVSIFEGFSRGKESNLWITFCGEQRSRIGVCGDPMCVFFMLVFLGEISRRSDGGEA